MADAGGAEVRMLKTINTLQLQLFHYVFAFEVMKERAEEAEKQADHYAKILVRVLGEAEMLGRSLDDLIKGLNHDENTGGGEQPPRAPDSSGSRSASSQPEA